MDKHSKEEMRQYLRDLQKNKVWQLVLQEVESLKSRAMSDMTKNARVGVNCDYFVGAVDTLLLIESLPEKAIDKWEEDQ